MIDTNLKRLRKTYKYTQEEVAENIGVSRQAVAKWENGETIPDINHCIALAELYNLTLDDLVNRPGGQKDAGSPSKGKHVFGTVKVGDRGQIVIPKRAREIFNICPCDILFVLGDEAQGIALAKHDDLMHFAEAVFKAKEMKED
ncbi:helix-turn-helix domain-containing protein [Paenibacillus donghaensis]|uniref:helix-turn-helix domain-containing protein n=1 Tax=Paenibacillus donghaensis TaxID=414771 RepID=UPI001883369D|nr:helix-turn-helix domain-containing protein [Paenibacillus donghaensis]MBE9915692.1 helix-turn-helix domain-containing protein [Paenibacillus donghaensis]